MEKKKTKEELDKEKENFEKTSSKQMYWVVGTMFVLIFIFLFSYYLFYSYNNFNYGK